MSWIEPKVDWSENDYFNLSDYERITSNIIFLKELVDILYAEISLEEMQTKDYQSLLYSEDFNVIEQNLKKIQELSFDLGLKGFEEWSEQTIFASYKSLNRIESYCKQIYFILSGQLDSKRTLKFELGGGEFGDVED